MGTYYALMQRIHDVVKNLESTGDLERVYSAQEPCKDSRRSSSKENKGQEISQGHSK
jgi:hypothetical protein